MGFGEAASHQSSDPKHHGFYAQAGMLPFSRQRWGGGAWIPICRRTTHCGTHAHGHITYSQPRTCELNDLLAAGALSQRTAGQGAAHAASRLPAPLPGGITTSLQDGLQN